MTNRIPGNASSVPQKLCEYSILESDKRPCPHIKKLKILPSQRINYPLGFIAILEITDTMAGILSYQMICKVNDFDRH